MISFSYLALVCLVRDENFEKHGLIDYNIHCFREAMKQIFDESARKAAITAARDARK